MTSISSASVTRSELPFLMSQEAELVGGRDKLLPIDLVELEGEVFNVVFNVTPDDVLHASQSVIGVVLTVSLLGSLLNSAP